jgi:hypothetical protein
MLAFAGSTVTSATMTLLETVTDQKLIPIVVTSGNIVGGLSRFDAGTITGTAGTYDAFSTDPEYNFGPSGTPPYNATITYTGGGEGFDTNVGTIHINGVDTGVYVIRYYVLGMVDTNAQIIITAGSRVTQSNVWYSPGTGTPTNGLSLVNSTTEQAKFLKSSRYY